MEEMRAAVDTAGPTIVFVGDTQCIDGQNAEYARAFARDPGTRLYRNHATGDELFARKHRVDFDVRTDFGSQRLKAGDYLVAPNPPNRLFGHKARWFEANMEPVLTTREICAQCHHISRVGFLVPDDIWRQVVPPEMRDKNWCIACFTELADEKYVSWDRKISFYPVSLNTHLDGRYATQEGPKQEDDQQEHPRDDEVRQAPQAGCCCCTPIGGQAQAEEVSGFADESVRVKLIQSCEKAMRVQVGQWACDSFDHHLAVGEALVLLRAHAPFRVVSKSKLWVGLEFWLPRSDAAALVVSVPSPYRMSQVPAGAEWVVA